MYIKTLHIYGFGKHENKIINFTDGLNVIYGDNEAGKTTIQQFILQIFYGFSSKNENKRNYEPKATANYGGKITIMHQTYGECEIERVRGAKPSGDVIITLPSKACKGEAFLPHLLYGYSRKSLEAIFAFSVEELQGMEQLSEEALSQVLLASGTTDIEKLTAIAQQMQLTTTSQAVLPPTLNEQLQKISHIEKQIKNMKREIATYDSEAKTLDDVSRTIEKLRAQKVALHQNWQYYLTLQQQLPLLIERQRIEEDIAKQQVLTFEEDKIKNFMLIKEEILATEATIYKLKQERKQEHPATMFNYQHYTQTNEMLTHETRWHQNNEKIVRLQEEILVIERDNEKQFRLLGVDEREEQQIMLAQDVSITKEEQFQQALRQLKETDSQLSHQLHILNDIHKELEALEGTTDTEGIRLRRKEEREQRIRQMQFVKFFAAIAAILFLLMSWWWKNVYTFVAGVACILVFLYIVQLRLRMVSERFVEEQIDNYKQRYIKIKEEIQALELLHDEQEQTLQHYIQAFYTKPVTDRSLMKELFSRVRKLQEDANVIATKRALLIEVQQQQDTLMQQVQAIVADEVSPDTAFSKVHALRETMQPAYEAYQYATKRIAEIDKEIERLTNLLNERTTTQQAYLTTMKVADEQALYEEYAKWQTAKQHDVRLRQLQQQITIDTPKTLLAEDVAQQLEQLHYEEQQIEKQLQDKRKEQINLQQTLQAKEEDEHYGELVQNYEAQKVLFHDMTLQWATEQAVIVAINQTFSQLKERKLPQVLAYASEYFATITKQHYTHLLVNEESYFEVETQEGQRYRIIELSQATKQQAYTALRFALAKTLEKSAPLPFIMDDPFVHFDRNRLMYMVQLIRAMSKERQIIYFTCQSNDIWQSSEVQRL